MSVKVQSIAWPSPSKVKQNRVSLSGPNRSIWIPFLRAMQVFPISTQVSGFEFEMNYDYILTSVCLILIFRILDFPCCRCRHPTIFVLAVDTCYFMWPLFLVDLLNFLFFSSGSCSGIFSQGFSLNRQPHTYESSFQKVSRFLESVSLTVYDAGIVFYIKIFCGWGLKCDCLVVMYKLLVYSGLLMLWSALQFCTKRNNTENSKQIFPEKGLRGLSPNFHIHVSVSDFYIPAIGLPVGKYGERSWEYCI